MVKVGKLAWESRYRDCHAIRGYTLHRHKSSFFDGRLDDNNMKDMMTEMIPLRVFAPLRLRVKSRTRKTQGCERRERTEIAVYAVCPSIHEISRICSSELYVKSVKLVFICG